MIDMIGGVVQLYINNLVEVLPHVKGAGCACSRSRAPTLAAHADVPTIAETLPVTNRASGTGPRPAGTPAAIVNKLNEVVRHTQGLRR